jgi:Ca2+-binding RTX toxin-like protein
MTSPTPSILVVVDPTVEHYQSLVETISSDAELLILSPDQDGMQQISQALCDRRGVSSLQIISHGHAGHVQLGTAQVELDTLESYIPQLQSWADAFSADADILLFGCNVAATDAGKAFVRRFSQLTGATVAASSNLTGCATLGGDWDLEFATGDITSSIALPQEALDSYPGLLPTPILVGTAAELAQAISNASSTPDADVIQLTANINLLSQLPAINADITIVGQGFTLDGGGKFRVLTIDGGTVTLSKLRIANGYVKGTAGTDSQTTAPGGNGGDGLGGGILINGGSVTVIGSVFDKNQAIGGDGGNSLGGGSGGNGGNGDGGAIYINGGSLRISTTTFQNNVASLGKAGTKTTAGQAGQGLGGALYVGTNATVLAEGNPNYLANSATTTANKDVYGSITIADPPHVTSINRADPDPTAKDVVTFTVAFDKSVSGVDPTDFSLATSGAITDANVVSVDDSGGGATYTVKVNTGTTIGKGTLGLNLNDDDSIKSGDVSLGATGLNNGDFSGAVYTIDKTPPTVVITKKNSDPTAKSTVTYTLRFNEDVEGVGTDDFTLIAPGLNNTSIKSVTKAGDDATYEVVANTGSGTGTLQLKLVDNDTILSKLRGVPLGGTGLNNGDVTGPSYTIDRTPPKVLSIARNGTNPTKASSVNYTVKFSQTVTGVNLADFGLDRTGNVSGASITSVNPVDGQTYTIAVNTGKGDGSLALKLVDNDSIENTLGVQLGGPGNNNGNFTGQTYTLLKSSPKVASITLANPNPTAASSINYTVTFNQSVTGVDASDFALTSSGISNASIAGVSGSGKTYNVEVKTGSGSGSLGLKLVDDDSIQNVVDTPLAGTGKGNGNVTGQSYTIKKTPPRITAINRFDSNPTNAAITTFAVLFNEKVSRVDPSDFTLTTQGVTGASITTVTRVNSSFYTVAVSTGSGDGTIGLNLVNNRSIVNSLGIPLSNTGTRNGKFTGEVYNLDRTSPFVDIIDVAPNPRRDKVDAITIQFSEAVKGFDGNDLKLTRNGSPIALTGATLTSNDGITWTLGNIKKLTNEKGDYALTLTAGDTGITDAAGNPLKVDVSDRWTNLETVDACDPGIIRRGSEGVDVLDGTADSDLLIGLNGDDILNGLDCNDTLDGGRGDDRLNGGADNDLLLGGAGKDTLVGGTGQDTLTGGAGTDRFVYSGATKLEALSGSLVDSPDQIKKFNVAQGDKILLDYNNSLRSSNRPRDLFNAGRVGGNTLQAATRAAYADKNQRTSGSDALRGNEAVFFTWHGQTYLSVNNGAAAFSSTRDLVVGMAGIKFKSGDANAGVLSVSDYFA